MRNLFIVGFLCVATTTSAADAAQQSPTTTRCLKATNMNMSAIGDSTVLIKQAADRLWISRLAQSCSGLAHAKVILTLGGDLGTTICRGDRFRFSQGADLPVDPQICVFGDFEKVTREQVEMLRASVTHSQ